MDVSAPRPPDPLATAALRPTTTPPARAIREHTEPPPPDAAPGEQWRAHSLLKFTLSAADVDARFEIHEATDTVTVTMTPESSTFVSMRASGIMFEYAIPEPSFTVGLAALACLALVALRRRMRAR